ncbi:ABC transporter substrate-binding protein [Marinobacter sp. CHS3-4]|uniref:ABC transporter substrate-binding protein n=1 Tax=Marinobacter sp. CHS3-4 TaxID=3045174 RepID=UPI0024B4C544|nr:ABC transporter substrate-binding protein [Marinobacter sp. CHS3-4]MDI9244519.1 ABC transporter substrate-binding protein [Marinobacter sp. CHS3-4]
MVSRIFLVIASLSASFSALSDPLDDVIEHWLSQEFTVSTLSPAEQAEELRWFHRAAQPYRGMTIRVVSERIDTHTYESSVLTKAFEDVTGIRVVHEITGEDDLVKKIQAQMDTGLNIYDGYINDTDFIGTHYRRQKTLVLSDYMNGAGKAFTLPTLDLEDFIGLGFGTAPDGKLYQLPDQQFANLYWYRHDWFSRPDLRRRFFDIYGYPLGVPQNWSAYEDIAEFFSDHVQEIDGVQVWGHMDYGRTDPSLGWRISDAWLSLAGMGDTGLPNGLPVDDWGIRVDGCHPVGASVVRGGALNGPAAIYAVETYIRWLKRFAPPQARELTFTSAGEWAARGQVAQQVFWYTAFLPAMTDPDAAVTDDNGNPLWRVAPSPRGAYWEEGMKSGYQDAGAWTFLTSTPDDRLAAAWLYAQFTVSKTVSLKKLLVGLTPIRQSDIESDTFAEHAGKLGGLVEFYRSQARYVWTPTGTNVPDYPALSGLWWHHISRAIRGDDSVENVMTAMAADFDERLSTIARHQGRLCEPRLNKPETARHWLSLPGAPKAARDTKPKPMTLPHEEAIRLWQSHAD